MIHYFTRATGVEITIMESMTKAVQFTYLCFGFFQSAVESYNPGVNSGARRALEVSS